MAHLERRRKLWVVVYHDGTGRGAQRRVTPGYSLKSDAAAHRDRLNLARAARKPVAPGALLLWTDLVQRWIATRTDRGAYSGRYAERARRQLTALAATHGWNTVQQIRPTQIEPLKIGSRRVLLAVLRFADRLDQPLDPRCLKTTPPVRPRKAKPPLLSAHQVALLLAEAALLGGPSAAAYAHCLATYGHRPESLAKLTVGAVQGGSLTLDVKGGDQVRHPLLPETLTLLLPLLDRPAAEPLFLDLRGKCWGTGQRFADWWGKQVSPVLENPALRGVYHLKRHAITRMLTAGLDVATIASITGHRTPAVLLTYARTNTDRQMAALAKLGAPRGHLDKP